MSRAALLIGLGLFVLARPSASFAQLSDCSAWPTNMALVHLKNAKITDPTQIEPSRTKATLLASEKKSKGLYRQIYDIAFQTKSGRTIEVITSSEASKEECSMSGVDVYVVSRKIGGGP